MTEAPARAVSGVVLAAGAGRRFGGPKAEVELAGRRLIDRAVALLSEAGCAEIVAVVRSDLVEAAGARTVVNEAPDEGMGSSLRIGLSAATGDAAVIVLVDQVGITPADIRAVIAEFRAGAEIVVPRRGGARSHPVLVARAYFAEISDSARGDRGARAFIDANPDRVRFLDLPDEIGDIDTPADLESFQRRSAVITPGSGPPT
ncbi:MAG: purine catabolism protein PucB [Frankiales bacterium]|nr:purine catabolism protein PucB [Frankiales bacterium]